MSTAKAPAAPSDRICEKTTITIQWHRSKRYVTSHHKHRHIVTGSIYQSTYYDLKFRMAEMAESRKGQKTGNEDEKPFYKERIAKTDIALMLALWMEKHPCSSDQDKANKCGAVVVKQDGTILCADFMKDDGVHPAARCMLLCPDKVKGCTVYMSRRPCSLCTKTMVQADIRKIVFLPRGEEHRDGRDREYVDHNISVRSIGLNVRVPGISNDLLKITKDYVSEKISKYGRELDMKKYARLCLKDFNAAEFDEQMKNDAELEYKKAMEWLELVTYGLVPSDVGVSDEAIENDNELKDISIYFIRMAYLLSLRSDDPKTGVGAVLLMGEFKRPSYIGFGWNGFPMKAEVSDYPRDERKYTYVIHAEHNALQFRNRGDLNGSICVSSRQPCDDCGPMLYSLGIRHFIYAIEPTTQNKDISYGWLYKADKEGLIIRHTKIDKTKQPPLTREDDDGCEGGST